jgi:hypothetical protein
MIHNILMQKASKFVFLNFYISINNMSDCSDCSSCSDCSDCQNDCPYDCLYCTDSSYCSHCSYCLTFEAKDFELDLSFAQSASSRHVQRSKNEDDESTDGPNILDRHIEMLEKQGLVEHVYPNKECF